MIILRTARYRHDSITSASWLCTVGRAARRKSTQIFISILGQQIFCVSLIVAGRNRKRNFFKKCYIKEATVMFEQVVIWEIWQVFLLSSVHRCWQCNFVTLVYIFILTRNNVISQNKLLCSTDSFFCTVLVNFLKIRFDLFILVPWRI